MNTLNRKKSGKNGGKTKLWRRIPKQFDSEKCCMVRVGRKMKTHTMNVSVGGYMSDTVGNILMGNGYINNIHSVHDSRAEEITPNYNIEPLDVEVINERL